MGLVIPVVAGGTLVRPGDMIVADGDGVVVMPREIGYVGSKGTHLGRCYDLNQPLRTREIFEAGQAFPRPNSGLNTINYFSFGTIITPASTRTRYRCAAGAPATSSTG